MFRSNRSLPASYSLDLASRDIKVLAEVARFQLSFHALTRVKKTIFSPVNCFVAANSRRALGLDSKALSSACILHRSALLLRVRSDSDSDFDVWCRRPDWTDSKPGVRLSQSSIAADMARRSRLLLYTSRRVKKMVTNSIMNSPGAYLYVISVKLLSRWVAVCHTTWMVSTTGWLCQKGDSMTLPATMEGQAGYSWWICQPFEQILKGHLLY